MLPGRIFFDDLFDDSFKTSEVDSLMKCDIYEKGDKVNIELDIPGFKKEDVQIELEEGYLTINASHDEEINESDDKKYIRRERCVHKSASRKFYVGDIDEEAVKAEFRNGTLLISVPKEQKQKETKKLISID